MSDKGDKVSEPTGTRWNLPPGGDNADGPRPSDGAITGIDGPDPIVSIKHDTPTTPTVCDHRARATISGRSTTSTRT